MPTTGIQSGGTFVSRDPSPGGFRAWNNPTNASSSNNSRSSTSSGITVATPSQWLLAQYFLTESNIPADAIITGVGVSIERLSSVTNLVSDLAVQLFINDVEVGDNKADTTTKYTAADVTVYYGGDGDLWGLPVIQVSDVVGAGFGAGLRAQISGGSASPGVDRLALEVFYVVPPNPDKRKVVGQAVMRGATI